MLHLIDVVLMDYGPFPARWLASELIRYLANDSYTANVNNADVHITSLSLICPWQSRLFIYFNVAF